MFRTNWKYLVAGLVVLSAFEIGAGQAEAFWGCGWGGACYTPCYSGCYSGCGWYSSCYAPCYSSCGGCDSWYLGVRPGPIRRALFGPYRWYYGGSCCGGCGVCSSCCSWDTCGSICEPGCDSCQPSAAPAEPGKNAPTAAPPKAETEMPASTQINTRSNSGLLTIWVPAKAKVFINDQETSTTGSQRRYVSHGLQPGLTYKYVVRAELERNGKIATETKTINLTAGGDEGVAFGFNVSAIQQFASTQQ
jgi:uncharacterized protein (TIGR03000 family)